MHCISTIIFKEEDFNVSEDHKKLMGYVKLKKGGLCMIEHTDENYDVLVRNQKPFITIYTDYFGGPGEQGCRYLPNDGSSETSINEGLRKLGIVKDNGMDEFDTVGLGSYRSNSDLYKGYEEKVEAISVNIEKKKIDKWDAIIFNDQVDGSVSIAFAGQGGAVIGASTYQEAEKRFVEAMNLAESVNKLLYFKEHGIFPKY